MWDSIVQSVLWGIPLGLIGLGLGVAYTRRFYDRDDQ